MTHKIALIELNDKEQQLFNFINWNLDDLCNQDFEICTEHFEKMGNLAKSLFARKAIPPRRLDWFIDPKLFIGGYKKSRAEHFVKNSGSINKMVKHPHFMEYIRYFIFGPALPSDTIDGFAKIIKDDMGTSGMIMNDLSAFVRKEIRSKKLFYENTKYDPADEFFKLAIEIGYHYPDVIYRAAKSVKNKS